MHTNFKKKLEFIHLLFIIFKIIIILVFILKARSIFLVNVYVEKGGQK